MNTQPSKSDQSFTSDDVEVEAGELVSDLCCSYIYTCICDWVTWICKNPPLIYLAIYMNKILINS